MRNEYLTVFVIFESDSMKQHYTHQVFVATVKNEYIILMVSLSDVSWWFVRRASIDYLQTLCILNVNNINKIM